jgi:hypothetical protein
MAKRIVRNTPDLIAEYLRRYDVDHLHYMAPITNAPSILAMGILSYNKAQMLPHQNVALWSVQERRESIIPGTDRQIHDYVPLYFATHTPMQYVLTRGTRDKNPVIEQKDLIFVELDALKIFRKAGVVFTDGNAAATGTSFFMDTANLNSLDWTIIRTPNCFSDEYKRKKAAEVLVPDQVPIDCFIRIVVFSEGANKELNTSVQHLCGRLNVDPPDLMEGIFVDKNTIIN